MRRKSRSTVPVSSLVEKLEGLQSVQLGQILRTYAERKVQGGRTYLIPFATTPETPQQGQLPPQESAKSTTS